MKKENSTNLQKYSGIAEQMLKLFSKHPETACEDYAQDDSKNNEDSNRAK